MKKLTKSDVMGLPIQFILTEVTAYEVIAQRSDGYGDPKREADVITILVRTKKGYARICLHGVRGDRMNMGPKGSIDLAGK